MQRDPKPKKRKTVRLRRFGKGVGATALLSLSGAMLLATLSLSLLQEKAPAASIRDSGAPIRDSAAPIRDSGAPIRDSGASTRDSGAPLVIRREEAGVKGDVADGDSKNGELTGTPELAEAQQELAYATSVEVQELREPGGRELLILATGNPVRLVGSLYTFLAASGSARFHLEQGPGDEYTLRLEFPRE